MQADRLGEAIEPLQAYLGLSSDAMTLARSGICWSDSPGSCSLELSL